MTSTNCWKKKSIFIELEYWKYLHICHNLDVMHIEKNVSKSIIGTLLNIPRKIKDGLNSHLNLKDMDIRCELAPRFVSMEELKLYSLKSHDYHTLMQHLLPVLLRSLLPKHVRHAIARLSFFFNALCLKVVDVSTLDKLQVS